MTELSNGTKKLAETYFPAEVSTLMIGSDIFECLNTDGYNQGVVPLVLALCSEQCPVSGEIFSSSANRAARETLATFPGVVSSTPEGFLENLQGHGQGRTPLSGHEHP
jgi:hypothetical protein